MDFKRPLNPHTATKKNEKPIVITLVKIYIDGLLKETIIQ